MAVALIKNTVCTVFLVSLLTGCHTARHVVTHVDEASVTQPGHREQRASSRLDSLFYQFTASADSITIVLYENAFPSSFPHRLKSAWAPINRAIIMNHSYQASWQTYPRPDGGVAEEEFGNHPHST